MIDIVGGAVVVTVAGVVLTGVGCAFVKSVLHSQDDRIEHLERDNGELRKENAKLRAKLKKSDKELRKAHSAICAVRYFVSAEYDSEIERLKEELAKSEKERRQLETMLAQKWSEASGNA